MLSPASGMAVLTSSTLSWHRGQRHRPGATTQRISTRPHETVVSALKSADEKLREQNAATNSPTPAVTCAAPHPR